MAGVLKSRTLTISIECHPRTAMTTRSVYVKSFGCPMGPLLH